MSHRKKNIVRQLEEQERIRQEEEAVALAQARRQSKNKKRLSSQQQLLDITNVEPEALIPMLSDSRSIGDDETRDRIMEFLQNHPQTHVETDLDIINFSQNQHDLDVLQQKAALEQLISPSGSQKPARPGYIKPVIKNDIEQEEEQEEQEEERLEEIIFMENAPELQEVMVNRVAQMDMIAENMVDMINRMNEETRTIRIYHDIYRDLNGGKEGLESWEVADLQREINKKFNTRVGWVKSKITNTINRYFEFANPIITDIRNTLQQLPSEFFTLSQEQLDFNVTASSDGRRLNLSKIMIYIGYILVLCMILFVNLIVSIFQMLNYIDTIIGRGIETVRDNEYIMKLKADYRREACIQSIGLIEYTLRSINISYILKLIFTPIGLIIFIPIMIISIVVFRNQSSLFDWLYVLFFKVLLFIVENTPATNVSSQTAKGITIIFINSQITGTSGAIDSTTDIIYGSLPKSGQDLVDYTANTSSIITSGASNLYTNTMVVLPMAIANISNQVLNTNLSTFGNLSQDKLNETITKAAEFTKKVADNNIGFVVNKTIDITELVAENILVGTFAFARILNDVSIFGASLLTSDKVNSIETLREQVEEFKEITDQQLGNDNLFISEQDEQYAIIIESTNQMNNLIKSPFTQSVDIETAHMSFIANKMRQTSTPGNKPSGIRNKLTINPYSVTEVDDAILKLGRNIPNSEPEEQIIIKDQDPFGLKLKGTQPEHIEVVDAVIKYKLVVIDEENTAYVPIYDTETEVATQRLSQISIQLPPRSIASSIRSAGGLILQVILPEEEMDNLIKGVKIVGNEISNLYSKINSIPDFQPIVREGVLKLHDTTKSYTSGNLDILKQELQKRSGDIKSSSVDIITKTLNDYEGLVKIGVVVAGGAALFYVAPAAVGLATIISPPLYTGAVTGLQLVGSIGSNVARVSGTAGYTGFNYLFFPTARMGMYMISKWFDLIARKTVGDVGLHRLVFGDTGMYLSFGGSVGPVIDSAMPFYNAIEPVVTENALAVGTQLNDMSEELATQILLHPNYVAAFATAMIASSASAVVGIAIRDDIKNPERIYRSSLRGSFEDRLQRSENNIKVTRTLKSDKILLDTPESSPRERDDYINMEHLIDPFDQLLPDQRQTVYKLFEQEKIARFNKLTPEEKRIRNEYDDELRQIRDESSPEDREEHDEALRLQKKYELNQFTKKYLEQKKAEEEESTRAVKSGFFYGGSNKTQKRRVKKSTRKHKKNLGKKGKSNKRRGSNKKRRHSRR